MAREARDMRERRDVYRLDSYLTRPASLARPFPSFPHILPETGPSLLFTARVEGALFHRAASASKKSGEDPVDSLSAALLDLKFESKSLKDPSFLLTGLL